MPLISNRFHSASCTRRPLLFWPLLLAVASLWLITISPAAEKKKVAVITVKESTVYSDSLKGLKLALAEGKVAVDLQEFDLLKEDTLAAVRTLQPDLIVTFGTSATKKLAQEIKTTPIVFASVLGPVKSGLDAPNVTGSLLNIPIEQQFKKFLNLVPTLKKIGVLYNPELNAAFVAEAQQVAAGMNLQLVTRPIKDYREIIPSLNQWLGQIDGFWFIADDVVCQPANVKHLLLQTLKLRKPVMGISPAFVQTGALLSLSCDYEDIGRQAGEICLRVLQGTKPADIPPTSPRQVKLHLNLNSAKTLGVTLSPEVIKSAAGVFGN